jgi:polysaccharide chain length determinant protein (PEP-CTERM system associated)
MGNLTLRELVRAVWRRPGWILLPILLGLGAAYALIRVLPPTYEAGTLVMVEKQKVPADYVKATVTTSMEDRIRTIEQQVSNRENLERLIAELGLYPELRKQKSMADAVERVRRDMKVQKQGDSIFSILFHYSDPVKTAQAANRVAELFIDDSLKQRETQAQGTSTFLESELEETKKRLEIQEGRIAAFKRAYMGQLPEQSETNLRTIETLQSKLEIDMAALDKAEQRKLYIQGQIAHGREAVLPLPRISAGPAAPPPPSRLDLARAELAALLGQYTEKHPDVIRKREEVAALEKQEREKKSAPPPVVEEEPIAAVPKVDPILRSELDGVDMEIRSLGSERERILTQIAGLQGRLENVPRIEQQLLGLTRDYDNIKKSYDSLLEKRINAHLAENLEKSQQGEQFRILEKAIPPDVPSGPNKLLIWLAGLAGGGVAGIALALLREQTDHTYADPESLQAAFPGVPILATIPMVGSANAVSAAANAGRAAANARAAGGIRKRS